MSGEENTLPDEQASTLAASSSDGIGGGVELRRGSMIGRYVVLDRVGRGAMGVVYAAYDARLDRRVALKLLLGDVGERDARRLLREAQAMARLSHPNVVTVHDVDAHGDAGSRLVLAMEFVEGTTLSAWLGERARAWREIVDMFCGAGRGLAAAHAAEIVHRDFKPENVLVGRDGRPRVTDFGIARTDTEARPTGDAREDEPLRTHAVGTPAYMSPEQHTGLRADARSDQFSFCVALYEALYGERPFGGESLAALAVAVVEGRVRNEPAGARVPGWVRRALVRGMSKDPAARYPSMDALIAALSRDPSARRGRLAAGVLVLGSAAAVAVGLELDERRKRSACERRSAEVAAVWSAEERARVNAAALASDISFAPHTVARVSDILDSYAAELGTALVAACVDEEIDGAMSESFARAREECLLERSSELVGVVDGLRTPNVDVLENLSGAAVGLSPVAPCTDVRHLSTLPPPPPPERRDEIVASRLELARNLRAIAAYRDVAIDGVVDEALALATDVGYATLEAEALHVRARAHADAGRHEDEVADLRAAFLAAERGGHDALAAVLGLQIGRVVGYRLGHFREGHLWVDLGAAARQRNGTVDDAWLAAVDDARAMVLIPEGRFAEAVELLRGVVATWRVGRGDDHPSVIGAMNNLAAALEGAGQFDESERFAREAIELGARVYGPNHPEQAIALNSLGQTMMRRGRFDACVELELQAVAILEAAYGKTHTEIAMVLPVLGHCQLRLGRLDAALVTQMRGVDMLAVVDHGNPMVRATTRSGVADVLAALDRPADALEYHRLVLEDLEHQLGTNHPSTAIGHGNVAADLVLLGRNDEALVHYERQLAVNQAVRGPDHRETALSDYRVGNALVRLRRAAEAEAHFRRAIGALGPDEALLTEVSLARALLSSGRAQQAERELAAVIPRLEADPASTTTLARALVIQAAALRELGRADEGLASARRAQALVVDDERVAAGARVAVALGLRAHGQGAQARELLSSLPGDARDDLETWHLDAVLE